MHVAQAILGSWAFHPPSFPSNFLGSLPRSSPASQRDPCCCRAAVSLCLQSCTSLVRLDGCMWVSGCRRVA